MRSVRIAAAQTLEFRENIDAALDHAIEVSALAEADGVALLLFPEAFLQGYLTDEPSARRVALDLASAEFAAILDRLPKSGPVLVFGVIEIDEGRLFNTAVVVERGVLIGRYRKAHLLRGEHAFQVGKESPLFAVDGLRFGINICYDTNFPEAAAKIAALGASLILCLSNNMMPRDRAETLKERHNAVRGERCRETGLWLISADVTGERDGRIAWGPTAVRSPEGRVAAQLPLEELGLLVFDFPSIASADYRAEELIEMHIRSETPADVDAIHDLTTTAFTPMPYSEGTEAEIIRRLRLSGDLTISLVAEEAGEILGHVAYSAVTIDGVHDGWFGLGPISVKPERQRRGIGRALIARGLELLREMGASGCALIGNPDVYGGAGFSSDGQLTYHDLETRLVQRIVFRGPAPSGMLRFAPAFEN
ncbi:putative amidohydrolase/putative N-acetyltransferase YhbS [Rhizobium fabae]|nr:putative amidohydrolase/putative N-acetyltransferase YhbS [Rhizobium fabae]